MEGTSFIHFKLGHWWTKTEKNMKTKTNIKKIAVNFQVEEKSAVSREPSDVQKNFIDIKNKYITSNTEGMF